VSLAGSWRSEWPECPLRDTHQESPWPPRFLPKHRNTSTSASSLRASSLSRAHFGLPACAGPATRVGGLFPRAEDRRVRMSNNGPRPARIAALKAKEAHGRDRIGEVGSTSRPKLRTRRPGKKGIAHPGCAAWRSRRHAGGDRGRGSLKWGAARMRRCSSNLGRPTSGLLSGKGKQGGHEDIELEILTELHAAPERLDIIRRDIQKYGREQDEIRAEADHLQAESPRISPSMNGSR